jgi:hypothetical protein
VDIRKSVLPVSRPFSGAEEIDALTEVLDSGWWGKGPKVAEFEKLFEQLKLPVEIIPQGRLNIPDAIEDGLSFIENAIIKARHASKISGKLNHLFNKKFQVI